MKVARLDTFAFLLLLQLGCGSFDASELPGSYNIKYKFGSEELILRENGEYVQTIVVGDETVVHKGTWRYDPESRDVLLESALYVYGNFGRLNPDWKVPFEGLLIRHVRVSPWRGLALAVDENEQLVKTE